jgi:hypothetical protein
LGCFAEEETTASPKISAQLVHSDTEEDKSYTGITDTVPSTGHSKQSKLEMVAPEEELDMLLNSLGGTHLSSSNVDESFGNHSTLEHMKINKSNEKVTPGTSSKLPPLSALDDDLDTLLSLPVQNEGFAASSLNSQPTFDSDNNIDFIHAKQIDVTSIDDSVDDLLADFPVCLNDKKQTTPAQAHQNSSNSHVPHSGSSNVSDDFDSWFDSLQK